MNTFIEKCPFLEQTIHTRRISNISPQANKFRMAGNRYNILLAEYNNKSGVEKVRKYVLL